MQFSELLSRLRVRVGNPSISDVPDADLKQITNDSYKEIANRYVFHKNRKIVTFPTVAPVGLVTTTRYNLPDDCLAVLSLWNTGSVATPSAQYKLSKKDETWLADQQTDPTNPFSGEPLCYVRQRGWVELNPAPDAIYTIRLTYKYSIADLVADGDVPVLPDVWHPGIVFLARTKYWDEYRLDVEKAKWSFGVWQTWIATKPDELQEEDFADNTEGVVMPTLIRSAGRVQPRSSTDFDRLD